ncbi:armadillo-type protein [Hygrophoropsis aurantiaca]|uniref:Armadillo-type protein n=1 Tax=Hygrophoropsis aurantiaca TaxID=72124 RepID=A0ACB8AKS4_9AGAM|nr:armadillo-type protein [Hygrophoropsis aurantiaca]
MFKGILPSKRISSSEFTMVTNLGESGLNGKENVPDSNQPGPLPKPNKSSQQKNAGKVYEKSKPTKALQDEPAMMNHAFDKLLDDLQIPSTLRPKLVNMDATVKAAMLKSSHVLTSNPPVSPPLTPRTVRKARSSESLASPHLPLPSLEYNSRPNPMWGPAPAGKSTTDLHAQQPTRNVHERGISFDAPRTLSYSQTPPVIPGDLITSKSKDKGFVKSITPVKFCSILSGTSSTQLEIETVKKLRLLLRNESASWSEDFLRLGGYNALLTRLNEILEVEWREEQHDDHILHELLRCFKALSTSSIGCFALRSSCPTPFVQLIALLYSDKKPGDVATRQLIVDLLLILFELYPSSSLPSSNGRQRREVWETDESKQPSSSLITLPAPHKTFYSLIRALLLTPAPPPSESPASPISPHAFIESLHRPRIYKTYLQELSDVCRDYFWVFCHPNNTIWNLGETDEDKVEKPKAPGGMTGGVEFEAMAYFTTHLKLINAIAKAVHELNLPKEHDMSAYRFHADLFASGFERIILISRKASAAYYPTLHLELARYISWTGFARYEIPWTVSRLIGPPPTAMCKPGSARPSRPPQGQSPHGSPTKRGPPAFLPSPKKVEPIKFD